MPRRLRIQFEGAIYHVMSRGNARQDIVEDDDDRQQFEELLAAQVARSQWEIISFVLTTSHFHLSHVPLIQCNYRRTTAVYTRIAHRAAAMSIDTNPKRQRGFRGRSPR